MKKQIIIILIILLPLFFTSCAGDGQKQSNIESTGAADSTSHEVNDQAKVVTPTKTNIDAQLFAHLQTIYSGYLGIKTALVKGDSKQSSTKAGEINSLIKNFNTTAVPGDQMEPYTAIAASLQKLSFDISATNDIKAQRASFSVLSDGIYTLLKSYGADKTIYQAHCPMAFDGKGASWLSDDSVIKNPYFGDEMLECGEVINVIKK